MKTSVYITFDTESSMGGAWRCPEKRPLPASRHVFCKNEKEAYGIPLIADELGRYNMQATFFCEMLATHVLGEEDTRSVTDFLLNANQDVQLHVHPVYRYYYDFKRYGDPEKYPAKQFERDFLSAETEEQQLSLLQESCEIFRKCTGYSPTAFRAGDFAADQTTLRILNRLRIPIDSSFNPIYSLSNKSFDKRPPEVNLVQKIEGVWEFPITVAKTRILEGNGYKNLDMSAMSSAEMEMLLNAANKCGMEHVTFISHCFSTVKPKDIFYSSFRPNWIVIHRLKKLLRFLHLNSSRFVVRTFGELAKDLTSLEKQHIAVVPDLGLWRPAIRKLVQGLNNFYWL
jgi:hypothetical protein